MHVLFALHEHPTGVTTEVGSRVVYDLAAATAHFGAAAVAGPAVRWEVSRPADESVYELRHFEDFLGVQRWALAPVPGDSPASADEHPGDSGERATGGATLAVVAELDEARGPLMRCDRVDFPPGAVAYRHVHPGPGIRRVLFGELTVTAAGVTATHRAGDCWFESGPEPVYAEASATEATAFVRVMLLPVEWAGLRTIRYTDPADADRPAQQRATVYLEEPLV